MYNLRPFSIFLIIALFFFQLCNGQNVVNNGSNLFIRNGANLVIGGNYINKNDGINDGKINLDGNIILKKDWINNANNAVLVSTTGGITGNVIMDGTTNQNIDGINYTLFENLIIRNSKKILNITDCEVQDTLFLDAILDLNSKRIKILNSNPIGIYYLSKYILSETNSLQGLGEVEWQIGSKLDTYKLSFGSGNANGDDLALIFKTNTSGSPSNGYVRFATYPTDCYNLPYPSGVNQLYISYNYMIDRFWNIEPIYTTKPEISIQFQYLNQDLNLSCNTGLNEDQMKAVRYNKLLNTWDDFKPRGTADPLNKSVSTNNISPNDFFPSWCLVSDIDTWAIFFPNAFTPTEDGLNESFAPKGNFLDQLNSQLYIYNRWGQLIFEGTDMNYGWNGYYMGKLVPNDVYVYEYIGTIKNTHRQFMRKGTVTLVR